MIYINSFQTEADVQSAIDDGTLTKPYVAYIESGETLDYNTKSETDYETIPLTFEVLGRTMTFRKKTGIEYSLNGCEWAELTANTIDITSGNSISFRANLTSLYDGTQFISNLSRDSGLDFKMYGNIMSLISSTGFTTCKTIPSDNCFYNFITSASYGSKDYGMNNIYAKNLVFPATALTSGCYKSFFAYMNVIEAPKELPATTLANNCYQEMFRGCTGLTSTPNLPATTLASNCCASMFEGCSSLTGTPSALPATTLTDGCYSQMFYNCTSLEIAPELPALTLVRACYSQMFYGCSNLNYVKCLATDASFYNSTSNWLNNVSSTGTFVTPSTTNWSSGASGIPNNWTRVNA